MRLVLVLLAIAAAGALAVRRDPPPAEPVPKGPARTTPPEAEPAAPAARAVPRLRCPRDADPACRAVRGRVVFVEAVDPDGDGDLHVVVAAGGISGPGITAIDVRPGLRPRRDPRLGDVVSAAGPVQRGSYGQDQIHALRFRAAR